MSELLAVPVVSKNGIRGKVLTASRLLDDSPEKAVVFDGGKRLSIPSEHFSLRADGTYYLNLSVDVTPAQSAATPPASIPAPEPHKSQHTIERAGDEVVIPRIEERVEIMKHVVETGRVRVFKTVTETPFTVDEPTIHERYEVERVPINRVVDRAEGVRTEGDVVIVPVYEEELVTTTRLVLREELRLTKRLEETRHPLTISLRKETVNVERTATSTEPKTLD